MIPSVFAALLILVVLAVGSAGILVVTRLMRRPAPQPGSGMSAGSSTDMGARA